MNQRAASKNGKWLDFNLVLFFFQAEDGIRDWSVTGKSVDLGVRRIIKKKNANEDEALPPGRGVRKGRPHGEAPEGGQARERKPHPEGAGCLAHVRGVCAGSDRDE